MIVSRTRILKFFSNLKFIVVVVLRALIILFKRRRSIEPIQLDHHTKYIFEKSYFAIAYEFKNALWFEFNGIKTTSNSTIVLFDRHATKNPVSLIVKGLFSKKEFSIDISADTKLLSAPFLTSINNLSAFNHTSNDLKLSLSTPLIILRDISFNIKPTIQQKNIKLSFSPFRESDYL